MINREIPYRPKLEGAFRERFYAAASTIDGDTTKEEIEKIAETEIDWVVNKCQYNLVQRRKYRAVWMLFRDLVRASWKAEFRYGILYVSNKSFQNTGNKSVDITNAKKAMRGWMSESRRERLVKQADFINKIEEENSKGKSIFSLFAGGEELADRIEKAHRKEIALNDAVKPYLQLVVEGEKDKFTGLKISDIWRYCRLTWSTPYETTPGRTMQYLIRDAAHPMHAIMGIASLENCTMQITDRDNKIGWNPSAFINEIKQKTSDKAKKELQELLKYIECGIEFINYSDLCTSKEIEHPTNDKIQYLFNVAESAEKERQYSLLKDAISETDGKSELGSISRQTEDALYKRKRAEQLARLLMAKLEIGNLLLSPDFDSKWRDFCETDKGISSIRSALVSQKTKHIGSSMLELNVCGAIPPYNEILGGKLVALLAASPQVVHDYKERYKNQKSEIASRIKGSDVYRPADLVYIGTTSLYYVGSSQYNRLKIPKEIFNSKDDIRWEQIGTTEGFGTLHISKATTQALDEATSEGYSKINHVFGEGSSPKMRLLIMGLRQLLESNNEDSKDLSKHSMARIVYGVCLASNTKEYLLGKSDKPDYYMNVRKYKDSTNKIIDYWRDRWLASRLNYEPIYDRIRKFKKTNLRVSDELNEHEKWEFNKLTEMKLMPNDDEEMQKLDFIRCFYRGQSAYADYMEAGMLSNVHIKTKLDDAILDELKKGKDIVLTGNAGDGKTHIIRKLHDKIRQLDKEVDVEIDASTLSNEDIYKNWKESRDNGKIYIIAINAAVLYSLNKFCGEKFAPVSEAFNQMINAVVYDENTEQNSDVTVFDLSKRNILTPDIVKSCIENLTEDKYYKSCQGCPVHDNCDVHKNKKLLNNTLFQKRLCVILDRITLKGYHATLRELQGMISYLIFGDRNCEKISKTSGNNEYDLTELIYKGKGNLFKEIEKSFDPFDTSHPILDEKILNNAILDGWIEDYNLVKERIAFDNEDIFKLRKRQFYFFNIYSAVKSTVFRRYNF